LLQINRSCETCHPYGEEELRARVETIQDRHHALLGRAGQAAVAMIDAIVAVRRPFDDRNRAQAATQAQQAVAASPGFAALSAEEQARRLELEVKSQLQVMWQAAVAADERLVELGDLQRAAQWRLDFVAAENSMGFHAPQELARILAESIDLSRQAQVNAVMLMSAPGPAGPPAIPESAPTKP
jgi:nitrite reductase (cytochrome c-552)